MENTWLYSVMISLVSSEFFQVQRVYYKKAPTEYASQSEEQNIISSVWNYLHKYMITFSCYLEHLKNLLEVGLSNPAQFAFDM